ncbi:MAG: hypothetical protein MI924_20715 [Chloroflexales bacterium]|nr:hypothetical protein [Chloroflexales bacterium]
MSPVSDFDTLFFIRVAEHVCQNHAVLHQILAGEYVIPNVRIVSTPTHFLREAEAHALVQSIDDLVTATLLAYAHKRLAAIAQTDSPVSPFDFCFFSQVMLRMLSNHTVLRATLAEKEFDLMAMMFKAWDETEAEEKAAAKNDPVSSC